ncbi:MAG TPA: non-homologous end-joining DNA ligase [Oculatellaceae cyanobacterium]
MLSEYKRKRDFNRTPEPQGGDAPSESKDGGANLIFVVQKHQARRLHYDFRLEIDGVLVSWAVPKGPSLDPAEKRLAVMTENHPLEYADFQGVIPSNEYGGGKVEIFDRGIYSPDEELTYSWHSKHEANVRMKEGLLAGKLSFYLKGSKLEGSWTLVKLQKSGQEREKSKEWLLIKHRDQFADASIDVTKDDTIARERTHANSNSSAGTASDSLVTAKNVSLARFPVSISPMLATAADAPFASRDWTFEPKLDGIRAIAFLENGVCHLRSRRGIDLTKNYPTVVAGLKGYPDGVILDGEVVALNAQGVPSFQSLQQSSGSLQVAPARRVAMPTSEIIYYVFDVLYAVGRDLTKLALCDRQKLLAELLRENKNVRLVHSLGHDGEAAFQACVEMGMEGVVGKRLNSEYEIGHRSKSWVKLKTNLSGEFVVCGFTEGTGARQKTFGSLILGEYDDGGRLVYVGGVGTGLDDKKIDYLLSKMLPLKTSKCPFKKPPQAKLNPTWLEPKLVVEVKFLERTYDNILRVPVYMHLRDDIEPTSVKKSAIVHVATEIKRNHPSAGEEKKMHKSSELAKDVLAQLDNDNEKLNLAVNGDLLALTNLNKVFWPEHGSEPAITKRDYLIYLTKVSNYVIPHLADRLITLVRFPNGIEGGRFYQKHWEKNLPNFVKTALVYTEHEERDQDFLVCNNLSTLLWLGQIADLELHTSHTRINPEPDGRHLPLKMSGSPQELEVSIMNFPDYLVLDLDPYLYSGKELEGAEPELHKQGFKSCCQVALYLKKLLDGVKLDTFIKTSGRTGLHIYIPIERTIDYDTVRAMSQAICKQILKDHPDEVTMDWAVVKRTGKVFMDHNMNARSKSLASIYSPRVAPEACVSTPVSWDELNNIYPTDFTMRSVPERLESKGDLWSDILEHKHDLMAMLGQGANSNGTKSAPVVRKKSSRSKKQKI